MDFPDWCQGVKSTCLQVWRFIKKYKEWHQWSFWKTCTQIQMRYFLPSIAQYVYASAARKLSGVPRAVFGIVWRCLAWGSLALNMATFDVHMATFLIFLYRFLVRHRTSLVTHWGIANRRKQSYWISDKKPKEFQTQLTSSSFFPSLLDVKDGQSLGGQTISR